MIIAWVRNAIEYLVGKMKNEQRLFEIVPGLFISSEIRDVSVVRAAEISVVIDLAGGFDPPSLATGLRHYLFWPIEDKPEIPDMYEFVNVAWFGLNCLQAQMGVLVHCTAGINRSSLLVGKILSLSGMQGSEIVPLISARRPGALTNDVFRKYLEEL
jgi:protein-tyrosine phosphatase